MYILLIVSISNAFPITIFAVVSDFVLLPIALSQEIPPYCDLMTLIRIETVGRTKPFLWLLWKPYEIRITKRIEFFTISSIQFQSASK